MMWGMGADLSDPDLSDYRARGVMRRLAKMLRPWRWQTIGAIALLVAQTGCLLAGPALVGYGIDAGLRADDAASLNLAAVLFLGVSLIGLVLGRATIRVVSSIGEQFLCHLRIRVFKHLMSLGLDFFERERTGRLVSRLTSDIDALQELVQMGLVMFVQNALLFVGALIIIFILSWQMALCVLVLVPPVVIATRWFRRASQEAYLEVRERSGANLTTLQEGLAGVRVVQAFGRERSFTRRFRETNEAQFDANLKTVVISTRYFPFVEFCGVIGVAMVIGIGGIFVDSGLIEIGVVAAFVLYLNNLFEPVQQLGQLYNTLQAAAAALHKLFSLLDTPASIASRSDAIDLPKSGTLCVKNVSFGYGEGSDVLHDVSIEISPGERIALVGPTGAGKSTLAKLLARFYDPREGVVSFGGVDLRDTTVASLRERIVVVPQEAHLFAGTIRENIRVGKPEATDEEIEGSLDALGIRERLSALGVGHGPSGLDLEVRERGSRLSAGERQLVSLARAALADPPVLVLDEATSNLDPGTESEVERALEVLTKNRTVIVVAHRLSTAERADRVAVVDDGRIVELGTHSDLAAASGRYASLWLRWTFDHSSAAPAS